MITITVQNNNANQSKETSRFTICYGLKAEEVCSHFSTL